MLFARKVNNFLQILFNFCIIIHDFAQKLGQTKHIKYDLFNFKYNKISHKTQKNNLKNLGCYSTRKSYIESFFKVKFDVKNDVKFYFCFYLRMKKALK